MTLCTREGPPHRLFWKQVTIDQLESVYVRYITYIQLWHLHW